MEIEPNPAYHAMLSWIATLARWLVAHPSGHTIFRYASTAADLTELHLMLMFLDGATVSRWVDAITQRENLFMFESSARDDETALDSLDSFQASDTIGLI